MVVILAETDGEEVWVWCGQSVIIDDEYIPTIQQTWDATTTRRQSAWWMPGAKSLSGEIPHIIIKNHFLYNSYTSIYIFCNILTPKSHNIPP